MQNTQLWKSQSIHEHKWFLHWTRLLKSCNKKPKSNFQGKEQYAKINGTLWILTIKFLLTITKEPWIIHVFGIYCLKTRRCFIYLVNLIKSSMNQLKYFKGVIVPLHGKDINVEGNKVHIPTETKLLLCNTH